MSTKCTQISLPDVFHNCQDMFLSNSPTFFSLLEENIDISDFIPLEFYNAFYSTLGRKREYPLTAFLSAFLFQKIVSVPTDSLLIILLHLCKELRDFCGFKKVVGAKVILKFILLSTFSISVVFTVLHSDININITSVVYH